jgi:DNA-binding CsgD family transcriptional regulator
MRKQVRSNLQRDVSHIKLTEREQEVLRLVVAGKTYREIGAVLYVTGHTAREYIARLYLKLGVTRRSSCVARAFEMGLVGPSLAKE